MSRVDLFLGGGVNNASGSSIFCVLSSVCGGASGCGGAFSLAGADVGAVVKSFVSFGVRNFFAFIFGPIFFRAFLGMMMVFRSSTICMGVTVIFLAVAVAGRSVYKQSAFNGCFGCYKISAVSKKFFATERLEIWKYCFANHYFIYRLRDPQRCSPIDIVLMELWVGKREIDRFC